MSDMMIAGPERLSLADVVRLIDIAYETESSEIRNYALTVLKSHFDPLIPRFVIDMEEPRG